MGSDHAAALAQAIGALYGGIGGEAQQQANAWLNGFAAQPQAWEACLELLDPAQNAEVCFFCANMLLTKVRKEWHKVPGEQQARMAAIIRCGGAARCACARSMQCAQRVHAGTLPPCEYATRRTAHPTTLPPAATSSGPSCLAAAAPSPRCSAWGCCSRPSRRCRGRAPARSLRASAWAWSRRRAVARADRR